MLEDFYHSPGISSYDRESDSAGKCLRRSRQSNVQAIIRQSSTNFVVDKVTCMLCKDKVLGRSGSVGNVFDLGSK